MGLFDLLAEIEKCGFDCDYRTRGPFIVRPDSENVRIVVISESPGEWRLPVDREGYVVPHGGFEIIRFIEGLFRGDDVTRYFDPKESQFRPSWKANAYWTHYQKCPIDKSKNQKITNSCERWLMREIEVIEPRLIVAVGNAAGDFLEKKYKLPKPEYVIVPQKKVGERRETLGLPPTKVNVDWCMEVAVVPHPSRRRRAWNYERFQQRFKRNLRPEITQRIKQILANSFVEGYELA